MNFNLLKLRPIVVVDLDGTVADCSNRLHLLEHGKIKEFHGSCDKDQPIYSIIDLVQYVAKDHHILFLTARPESSYNETVGWIRWHIPGLPEYSLKMRKDYDEDDDHTFKLKTLTNLEENGFLIRWVIEDRTIVVDKLREAGFTVLQPAKGDY